MATSVESTLKLRDVDEELQCPICLERFTNPRTLPCSHTFCHYCLDDHIKHRTIGGEFPCPFCREAIKTPPNGANDFQRNILANNLVDILATQRNTKKDCSVCSNGTKAIHICLDCPEHLCELHKNDHKKMKLTMNHLLVPLNDVQQGKYEHEIRARQAVHCTNHPDEKLRYFCTECKIAICVDCVIIGECPHTCNQRQNLTVVGEKMKAELKIYVAQLQAQIKEKDSVKELANNSHKQASASLAVAKREIEEWYGQLIQALRASKHNYIATLEQKVKDKCCAFTTLTSSIEDDLKRLKLAEKQALMVCNYGNPSEIILSHCTILTELQKLEKEISNREPPCSFTVSFAPNQSFPHILAQPKQVFGEIYETVLMKEFDTKLPEDQEGPALYGIVIHINNDISALDNANIKLKTFSGEGILKNIFTGDKSYSFDNLIDSKLLPSGEMLLSDFTNVIMLNSNVEKITKIYPVGKNNVFGVTMNHAGQLVFTTREDVPSLTVWNTQTNSVVLEVNKNEKGENLFQNPDYVTVNSKGHMIVTDCGKDSLFIFDLTGALLCDYNPTADHTVMYNPLGVCTDEKDNIYVADCLNNRIIQLTPEGQFARVVVKEEDGLDCPCALTFDNQGNLVISETNSDKIKVFQLKSM